MEHPNQRASAGSSVKTYSAPVYSLLCTVTVVLMLLPGARVDENKVCLLFQSIWVSLEGDAVGLMQRGRLQMQRNHWLFFLHHINREPLNHGGVPERWKSVLNCMPSFYPISLQLKSMCGVLYPRRFFLDRVRSTVTKCRCCASAQFLTAMPAVGVDL